MSLKVSHVVKRYGDLIAVNDLNFEISRPGVFALLGTNGAGKTTAIRSILGMLSIQEGEITWNDKKFRAVDESIGYLAEERGLYPKYKIMEQLVYFSELKGLKKGEAVSAINYWFDRLNINEYKTKKAEQLSKGNQQKIQLIAALIADPKLLILDEPLSGLDPVNTDLFKSIIREEMAKEKYIIMSSHQMPVIEEFCEDIVILNHGKTVLQGNLNAIKKSYGRVNLTVKAEADIMPIANEVGLSVTNQTPNGTDFKVSNEEQAREFLKKAVEQGINIIKFDLREPSLHEIFVEKAGVSDERN